METHQELLRQVEELRTRLEEAEETLRAIRSGEVDALVVGGPEGDRVFTLQGAEHPYRLLVETISEGAVTLSADGSILYCNQSFAVMLNAPLEQLIGSALKRFVSASDMSTFERLFERGLSESGKEELTLTATDGRKVPAYLSIHSLQLGEMRAACMVVTDLTEQKRMEEVVSAEKLARSILEQANEAIVVCDTEGRITRASRRAHHLSDTNLNAQPFERVFPLQLNAGSRPNALTAKAQRNGKNRSPLTFVPNGEVVLGQEVRFDRHDGQSFTLLLNAGPLYSTEHKILGYVVTLMDVTERKRAEEALLRAHEELERRVAERTAELAETNRALQAEISERRRTERARQQLLQQLVTTQEEERRRIARDLHDHLGQQLTALRFNLETLKERCGEDTEMGRQVERIQSIARRVDADVDFLAWELRPTALDDLGLVAALANFLKEWSKHSGIPAKFHSNGIAKGRLSPEIEANLYRITQEALNNVSKYARASHVDVILERRGGRATLIIEDDGRGFDSDRVLSSGDGRGLGLIGMRERASLVGGTLEIESAPGEGTTIYVRLPVSSAEEGEPRA